jgi:hypothetical protein
MAEQTSKSQNLDLLGIFHYVLAAFIFLNSLAGLIFVGIGSIAIAGILSDQPHDMNIAILAVSMIFFLGPLIFMGLMWTLAVLVITAGKRIGQRTSPGFCLVVAGLECLFVPFGTILGILTLIALTKEETRKEFH